MKAPWRALPAVMLVFLALPVSAAGEAPLALIPMPAEVLRQPGSFTLRDGASLGVESDDPEALAIAHYLAGLVQRTRGLHLRPVTSGQAAVSFRLAPQDPDLAGDEAYRLEVDDHGIRIEARAPAGLFYGAVTLWQLLTPDASTPAAAIVPALVIRDRPRFPWRGLMLDSARHFQSVADIERLLDWMALHKLNVLQWHLTDDQGWRLEIRGYPRLTYVGDCRRAVGPDAAITGSADKPYCGFYTQAEAREVVRYAAERYITVVPEIEMPGHAQAAIAAYPEFGVTGTRPPVSTDWGIHPYLYNVDAKTLKFLETVLDQVMALFPSRYIDVGGDEALKDQWKASTVVQTRMKALGIADEDNLQAWMVKQMEAYLRARGRRLLGWDEILQGGLPPQATVMSWHGAAQLRDAIAGGHDVVLAYSPTLYLDNLQSDAHDEPPGRPPVVSLKDIYRFEPLPEGADAAARAHVLGVQASLWTEYMPTFLRDQHAVFPRLAALAEVAWSPLPARDWEGFLARLPAQLARYRRLGIQYADSAFEPRFTLAPAEAGKIEVSLSTQAGVLHYSTDDREPTSASPLYTGPMSLTPPARVIAASFAADGSRFAERTETVDRAALDARNSDQLDTCSGKLVLRIEDNRPLAGQRPVYRVDIMDMCWRWKGVSLDGLRHIAVSVGDLPWNYQLAHDVTGVVVRPVTGGFPSLDVHLDGCDGAPVAHWSLRQAAASPLQTTLRAELPPESGRHDLCFTVSDDPKQQFWAIDTVQLTP